MKKHLLLFLTFLLFFVTGWSQTVSPSAIDSAKKEMPAKNTTILQKVDSLQAALNKQHAVVVAFAHATGNDADTAATPADVENQLGAFMSKWKVFTPGQRIGLIIGLLLAVFFSFSEYHIPGVIRFAINFLTRKKGAVSIILLFFMMGLPSCKVTTVAVTPYGGTVSEQLGQGYILQEKLAIHTDTTQNDSLVILAFGPTKYTNVVFTALKNYAEGLLATGVTAPATPVAATKKTSRLKLASSLPKTK